MFEIYQIGSSFFSNKKEAIDLTNKSFLGERKQGRVIFSVFETLYLLESQKVVLIKKSKKIRFEALLKKQKREIKEKYIIFSDLTRKAYILKTGLKFGADFRVYEKKKNPKMNHADYLLCMIKEGEKFNLNELISKTRIAHSTNKKLLIAILDSQEDIVYYEINWKRV